MTPTDQHKRLLAHPNGEGGSTNCSGMRTTCRAEALPCGVQVALRARPPICLQTPGSVTGNPFVGTMICTQEQFSRCVNVINQADTSSVCLIDDSSVTRRVRRVRDDPRRNCQNKSTAITLRRQQLLLKPVPFL